MKIKLLFIALLLCIISLGQLKPIPQKLVNSKLSNRSVESYNIFTTGIQQKDNSTEKFAKGVSIFKLEKNNLSKLYKSKPTNINLKIPFEGESIEVELIQNTDLFTENFKAIDQKNKLINYKPGLYYHGIIHGDNTSLVAISIFENEVIGIASSKKLGDIVIGKLKNSENYISYSSYNMKVKQSTKCSINQLKENRNYEPLHKNFLLESKNLEMTKNCVRIFYEIGYNVYEANESDETKTLNWMTAVYNNIHTIYQNDYIKTAISTIKLWKEEDPYGNDPMTALYLFKDTRTSFDGDFAHLIKLPYNESYAFLDSLCKDNNYAIASVEIAYNNYPVYSWTVTAIAHEMGHILGSHHTHACVWNGNYTAIDGCVEPEGFCPLGPIPYEEGGTIMSYCINNPAVGINLSNGFGEQPANLMRKNIDSKGCLTTDCSSTCQPTIMGVSNTVDGNKITFTIDDSIAQEWKYNLYVRGDNKNEWKSVTNKTTIVSGLNKNSYYILEVATKCSDISLSKPVVKEFDTYNYYCEGDYFYDTGGIDNNYKENEVIIKTFLPNKIGDKVSLTFLEFDIYPALEIEGIIFPVDFMNIYNGLNVDDDKLFENGKELNGNSIPGPFTSTDDSGAITIYFDSSGLGPKKSGWKAKIDCGNLNNQEVNELNLNIYPNPTSDLINITIPEKIIHYELFTTEGKLILKKNNINSKNVTINLNTYPNGIYIVKIKTDKNSYSRKITKK